MEEILAITFIFGGGSLFLLAISPVGRAIASRIQGRVPGQDALVERVDDLEQWLVREVDGMRQHVTELEERLDFTERMLAQKTESPGLPAGDQEGV